jgi:RloB-like protein
LSRENSLRRREQLRAPKRKFVIFCEGANTEPRYFDALRRQFKGAIIDIEIVRGAGVPATIAASASAELSAIRQTGRRSRQSFDKNDQVWAVFDEDAHPGVPQALQRCRTAGVGIAYSNPCFELWLILHREPFDRPDDRHQVQRHLETLCPEYDRNAGKSPDCATLVEAVEEAEALADAQQARRIAEGAPFGAPSTTVQDLTRALRAAHASFAVQVAA